RKDDRLRRLIIYRAWRPATTDESAIPPAVITVRGAMTDERRQRLRKYLIGRWRDQQPRREVSLTPAQLAAIARLDHVEAVTPEVYESAEVRGDGLSPYQTSMVLLAPGHRGLEKRLVAGRMPDPARPEALVSETVLYDWGVADDAAVERFLGRTVTVAVREDRGGAPYHLLELFGIDARGLSPDDLRGLGELADHLPGALERL